MGHENKIIDCIFLYVICACLFTYNVWAREDSLQSKKKLNQIMIFTIGVNAITLGQTFFYTEQDFSARNFSPLFFATNALQHLPNLRRGRGLGLLMAQALTTASFYLTQETPNDFPLPNRALFAPSYNLSLFASYLAYRDRRNLSADAPNGWKPFKIKDLLLAPYRKESVANAFVWGAAIGAIGLNWIAYGNENSVFAKGKTYIGNREYSPWIAIPVMIGSYWVVHSLIGASEEAHYRGVVFEQTQKNTSTFWASAFDVLYFTASHFPQYYITDKKNLFFRTASATAFSFLMSSAYRHSGLTASSAAHIAFNFFSSTSYYLLNGGAADANNHLTFSLYKNF